MLQTGNYCPVWVPSPHLSRAHLQSGHFCALKTQSCACIYWMSRGRCARCVAAALPHREVNSSLKNLVLVKSRWVLGSPSSAKKQQGRLRSRAVNLHVFRDKLSWARGSRLTRMWGCGSSWGWDHLAVGSFQFPKTEPGALLKQVPWKESRLEPACPHHQVFLETKKSWKTLTVIWWPWDFQGITSGTLVFLIHDISGTPEMEETLRKDPWYIRCLFPPGINLCPYKGFPHTEAESKVLGCIVRVWTFSEPSAYSRDVCPAPQHFLSTCVSTSKINLSVFPLLWQRGKMA